MSQPDRTPRDPAPIAVLVLGMHASGASTLSRVLERLGVELGPRSSGRAGRPDHVDVLRVHDELLAELGSAWDDPRPLPAELLRGRRVLPYRRRLRAIVERDFSGRPLWGLKDPRLCRLVPLWRDLLAELGHDARFVLMARPAAEVAASLRECDGVEEPRTALLWLEHLLAAEQATRGTRRAFLTRDGLLRDWRASVGRVTRVLGLERDEAITTAGREIDELLDPDARLLREVVVSRGEAEHPWLRATYRAWEEAADGSDPGPALAAIRDRLWSAGRLFFPWTDHLVENGRGLRALIERRDERAPKPGPRPESRPVAAGSVGSGSVSKDPTPGNASPVSS